MLLDTPIRRRTFLRGSVTATALGVVSTGTAAGATVTVSPGDSIQAAVDEADSGDVVHVAAGTYKESVTLPPEKALTLVGDPEDSSPGAGSDAPVLEGDFAIHESAFSLPDSGANRVEIKGFRIQNYGTVPDDTWGHGISTSFRSNVLVEDCSFHNIAGPGIAIFGDGSENPADWTVRRNAFSAIAHSAVHLSANDRAAIVDNVVESGNVPVGDSPDRWWEEGTDDNNPKAGIEVHATGRNDHSATLSDVVIRGNRITGTYDDTAIRVLSINKNDDANTRTLATGIEIRENTVDITDELGDEIRDGLPADENGITVGANPESGAPAAVTDVWVVDNRVRGAGQGVLLSAADSATIRSVTVSDNSLQGGLGGVLLAGGGENALREIEVRGNQLVRNRRGLVLLAGTDGTPFEGVRVRENRIADNDLMGVIAIGPGDPDGAAVYRNDVVDNVEAGVVNESGGTLVANCNFWGHATGPDSEDNAKGRGNAVVGAVGYEPWLPQSFTRVPEEACKLENRRPD